MKELIKEAETQVLKIPKFKGRTTIVLKNAKTGEIEKEVVEENMVTNAVARIFASNWCGQLDYSQLMPIATKTLGGVLCWANPIEENADNIYPPITSSNPLTAHAGQTVYTTAGDDSKRGNPNSIVSGRTATGYSNTWDFPSTQGNGLISCISLTHSDFGDFFTYGGSQFKPTTEVMLTRAEANKSTEEGQKNTRYIYCETQRCAYGFYINGTSLRLRKHKHFSNISQDVSSVFPISGDYEDIDITLGHTHSLSSVYLFDREANKLILIIPKSNGSNTLNRDIINLNNYSVASDELVISGATFLSSTYQNRYAYNELTKSGRLYLPSNHNTFYGINYSNPADTIETENIGGYSISITYSAYSVNGDYIQVGNSIIEGNKNYLCSDLQSSYAEYIKTVGVSDSPVKQSVAYQRYDSDKSTGPILNKMYIGTINNLENPVTKTSAQTMTITYELIMEE